MPEAEAILNRVAKSGIETIDLGEFFPQEPIHTLDIKDWLFHGLILREKDFREQLESTDWETYRGALVAIHCSTDAIIPIWAYMLLTTKLEPIARRIVFGTEETLLSLVYDERLHREVQPVQYTDKRVVVKGCGDKPVPVQAYVTITALLQPFAKSIMYGEPCSTVPVYKKPKA